MTLLISNKGWVVIPAELRKKYKLNPGASVQIVDYGGVLAILPALIDPVHQAAGMLKAADKLTDTLLEEHEEELRMDTGNVS